MLQLFNTATNTESSCAEDDDGFHKNEEEWGEFLHCPGKQAVPFLFVWSALEKVPTPLAIAPQESGRSTVFLLFAQIITLNFPPNMVFEFEKQLF